MSTTCRVASWTAFGLLVAAGCASAPPGSAPPVLPLTERPSAALESDMSAVERRAVAEEFFAGVRAVEDGRYELAYALLLRVAERCATTPLGRDALLALAAAELDPRNGDPRLHLAAEAAAHLLVHERLTDPERQLAETLYLVSLRLGAGDEGLAAFDTADFRHRLESAAQNGPRPGARCARPALLARSQADAVRVASSQEAVSERALPALPGSPYPRQLAQLRARLQELEEEVGRLRRLTRP